MAGKGDDEAVAAATAAEADQAELEDSESEDVLAVDELPDEEEEDSEELEELAPSKKSGKKRKKKRKGSQFFDEEAMEDSDEDEDEEGGAGGAGPSKKRSKFIDDMAAIGEEDEDDLDFDIDDPFIMNEQSEIDAIKSANMSKMYRQVDTQDKFQTDEDLEKFVKERYMQRDDYMDDYADDRDDGMGYDQEATEVERQALLPSKTRDPFLWLVRVKSGSEQDVVVRLMQKTINLEQERRKKGLQGRALHICSAMHHRNLKGYIYVEARKQNHVKKAVSGLQDVYHSKEITMVPHKEMPEAVQPATSVRAKLRRGSWVRVRGGLYKGDIGRVEIPSADQARAIVNLVPRLDMNAIKNNLKGKAAKSKFKMAAKSFSAEEIRSHCPGINKNSDRLTVDGKLEINWDGGRIMIGYGDSLDGKYYKEGYLLRPMSVRGLEVNVKPTYDELFSFNSAKVMSRRTTVDPDTGEEVPAEEVDVYTETLQDAAKLEDQEVAEGSISNRKACSKFARGDSVIVVKGELKNLVGTVQKIREQERIVIIKPVHEELTDLLEIDALELDKYFTVGKHVKVVRGRHEGSTGMVVKVFDSEGLAEVFSDTTQENMKVFIRDLEESTGVTHGLTKFGEQYNLLDLVALTTSYEGVIVSVEKTSCRVLTTESMGANQKVDTCKLQDISRKVFASRLTAMDCFNNIVNKGDVVKVIHGDWRGKQGVVKHVAKNSYLFIECRDVLQNLGIVCLKGKSCTVVGGEQGGSGGGGSQQRRASGPGSFGRKGVMRRTPLIGKTITIKRGPYKNYVGKVVDASDQNVQVELEAQPKTVTLKHSHLRQEDRQVLMGAFAPAMPQRSGGMGGAMGAAQGMGMASGMASVYGSQTPMHAGGVYGAQTPMHPGLGAYGSQTPMHPGIGAAGAYDSGGVSTSKLPNGSKVRVGSEDGVCLLVEQFDDGTALVRRMGDVADVKVVQVSLLQAVP